MSPSILELDKHRVDVVKQPAAGTPGLIANARRLALAAGSSWAAPRTDGSAPVSDMSKYGDRYDWAESLVGNINIVPYGTVEEICYLLWIMHGAESVTAPSNETQTLTGGTATGGTFKLKFRGIATTDIAFNATAATIDAALEALANIGVGEVTCAGGPINTTPVTVAFSGALGSREVPALEVDGSLLTGGTAPTVAKTTPGAKRRFRFTPGSSFFYASVYGREGLTVIRRQIHRDVRFGQIQLQADREDRSLRCLFGGISTDPAENNTTDPAGAMPTKDPVLFHHAANAMKIDGTTYRGLSRVDFAVTEDLQNAMGDDIVPFATYSGSPGTTLRPRLWLSQEGLDWWYDQYYGTPTPTAGQKPSKQIHAIGDYEAIFRSLAGDGYLNGDRIDIRQAGVKWNLPEVPGPNPTGGPAEMELEGGGRISGSSPMYEIDIYCDEAAAHTV